MTASMRYIGIVVGITDVDIEVTIIDPSSLPQASRRRRLSIDLIPTQDRPRLKKGGALRWLAEMKDGKEVLSEAEIK